jgi:hypothetical protein
MLFLDARTQPIVSSATVAATVASNTVLARRCGRQRVNDVHDSTHLLTLFKCLLFSYLLTDQSCHLGRVANHLFHDVAREETVTFRIANFKCRRQGTK